jgi:hypothetical protein
MEDHGLLYIVLGRYSRYSTLAAIALILLATGNTTRAANGPPGGNKGVDDRGAVRLLTTVPIPGTAANTTNGKLYSYDISFVDRSTQTYYLADRSNAAVDVVDAKNAVLTGQISVSPPFRGFVTTADCTALGGTNCSGPNGVVAAYPWLFVTDGASRVVNIDLRTGNIAAGGDVVTAANDPNRADELAYDPTDGLLLVINNADTPPFGTLIKVDQATGALTVGTKIVFDAAHGVAATDGAEQPVWDPRTGKFYLSIPVINGSLVHGAVLRISTTGEVETQYPVDSCGPAGLTVGPSHDLLVGCNRVFDTAGNIWSPTGTTTAAPQDVILDVDTGNATAGPGAGAGDEVWYNAGDNKYYATGSGSPFRPIDVVPSLPLAQTAQGSTPLGVIDAATQDLIQLVPTFNVPAVGTGNNGTEHPAGTAHSVAANAANNYVFVPLAANNVFPGCLTGCVAVFFRPSKVQ